VFFIVENIKDRLLFFFFIVMNKAKNFVVGVIILDLRLTLSAILFLRMGEQDGVWEHKVAYGSTRWPTKMLFLVKVLNTGFVGRKT
jgi:hypothetical protein